MTLDIVVDIFNRVNTGGTTLSKGDLALSRICADWPDARDVMKQHLAELRTHGYDFSLDWLLRCVNTVLTGEAEFRFLHHVESEDIRGGLKRASTQIERALNLIAAKTGLDHARVLFGVFAFPVIARYLDSNARHPLAPRRGQTALLVPAGGNVGTLFRFNRDRGSTKTSTP